MLLLLSHTYPTLLRNDQDTQPLPIITRQGQIVVDAAPDTDPNNTPLPSPS